MEYAAIKSYVSKLLFQIQTEINISNSDECIGIDRALHMMRFIRPLCDELRKHTVNYQFRDEAEEIYFFKELKPEVLSKYMYYNKIYVIESKFPTGSDVAQKEYLYNELNSLTFYSVGIWTFTSITVLNLLIWIDTILPEIKMIYEYVQTVPILIKTLYIQPDMILKWLKLLLTNC